MIVIVAMIVAGFFLIGLAILAVVVDLGWIDLDDGIETTNLDDLTGFDGQPG